MSGSTFWSLG
jgi:hypothetical protein